MRYLRLDTSPKAPASGKAVSSHDMKSAPSGKTTP
jgi:hypothetical protein